MNEAEILGEERQICSRLNKAARAAFKKALGNNPMVAEFTCGGKNKLDGVCKHGGRICLTEADDSTPVSPHYHIGFTPNGEPMQCQARKI